MDLGAASAGQVPEQALDALRQSGVELRQGIVLVDEDAVPSEAARALDSAGALQPVFSGGGESLMVVLPEVRIETDGSEEAARVRTYLDSSRFDIDVEEDAERERFVVRPRSGRGADALKLANEVAEAVNPAMAQARFLRVVPKP